jgi:hypothetical protein
MDTEGVIDQLIAKVKCGSSESMGDMTDDLVPEKFICEDEIPSCVMPLVNDKCLDEEMTSEEKIRFMTLLTIEMGKYDCLFYNKV